MLSVFGPIVVEISSVVVDVELVETLVVGAIVVVILSDAPHLIHRVDRDKPVARVWCSPVNHSSTWPWHTAVAQLVYANIDAERY